jgi:hypothetical protein
MLKRLFARATNARKSIFSMRTGLEIVSYYDNLRSDQVFIALYALTLYIFAVPFFIVA